MTRARGAAGLLLGCLLSLPCRASDPEKPWYEQVSFDALVSASYSYNFNRPDSRTNPLRVFDFDDDTFKSASSTCRPSGR